MIGFRNQARAQIFGGTPPNLHWQQINNDTVRVIFPAGLKKQAENVAAIAGALNRLTLPTIGSRKNKIDIVFQNQTVISNGFVQLAPFRSEFQLTPDQNSFELGSLPWQQQLAIHEYRHVQQYNNFRIGISRVFYYLFGQGGQELANSMFIPNWFWEGDAVFQETLVSNQGRGRLPFFFSGYQAIWAAGKEYTWMKLRNGSLRDYTPDHYPLGYMMVAYGRDHYGPEFWRKISVYAAADRSLFYPWQVATRKFAGLSYLQFRQNALNYFSCPAQKDSLSLYAKEQKHFVADEEFPQFPDSQHLIYLKSTYKKPSFFVVRNLADGRERVIRTRAVSADSYFSVRKNKIVYCAYEPDARWGWRDYSVIRLLDIRTGLDRRISGKSKYFSPDLSEDGQHIVAVYVDETGKSSLRILNAETSKIEKIFSDKNQYFHTYPKFYSNSEIICAIRNKRAEMALVKISLTNDSLEFVVPFSNHTLGFPSVWKDSIFFTITLNGLDRMIAYARHALYEIKPVNHTNVNGDYELQFSAQHLAFTSLTAVGYKITTRASNQVIFSPVQIEEADTLWRSSVESLPEKGSHLLDSLEPSLYTVEKYPSQLKLFNFHTWRPYINDPDYSFSLVSENVLATLQSEIYAGYNRNEQYKQFGTDASFAGWFPWVNAGISYTIDRNAIYLNSNSSTKVYWNELQATAGLSVPLTLSRGRTYTSLTAGSSLIYNQRFFNGSFKDSFDNRGFFYINPSLTFIHQTQQARMQINPDYAQTVAIQFNRTVSIYRAHQFMASGYFYFPGIFPLNSLVLGAAYQQRDLDNNVRFGNSFPFSRGYSADNFYKMYRLGATYHFPLAYPDWGFADMVYILRVRAALFFDYTRANDFYTNGQPLQLQFRSLGTEVYVDTKFWNQLAINFGIRYSRLLDNDSGLTGRNRVEFILPLSILGN
jgi:hypothetical protein